MSEKETITDFISGRQVQAKPEEVEAVQVFARQLVEDYNYPKSHIQTHPQHRVKARPSDKKKEYPVDIAVFSGPEKNENQAHIIVECKREDRDDGLDQLKDYLRFSKAKLGVWFNGQEKVYLRKVITKDDIVFDDTIPNIPKHGQRVEDVGLYKRKDLQATHNLKEVFVSTRNFLAGNTVGITRDEELAKQMINLIFCKLYDEKFTKPNEMVKFRAGIGEAPSKIAKRIKERFQETKNVYQDVLEISDTIKLDNKSIAYVVGELQSYCLMDAQRDVVGDAFEVFLHNALKGGQGQFFTPKNVVKTAVEILDPDEDDKIIDPACGSGGFLVECLKHIHTKIEDKGHKFGWPDNEIEGEKIAKANINLRGIEKDNFLSKVAKAYMVIMGDGKGGIFCEDSLVPPNEWKNKTQSNIQLGQFDLVLTNPPFGAKIPVKGKNKLQQYELGHDWSREKRGSSVWEKGKLKTKESPQIIFIERCLQLLKDGGRMGIVLPDGVLSNTTDRYIIQFLEQRAEIIGVIDLPMSTFLPYTPTKTHLVFLRKTSNPDPDHSFFMSYAKTCGHDKRGREVNKDEISMIPEYLEDIDDKSKEELSHLGFKMEYNKVKDRILAPKYYNPDINNKLREYEETGDYIVKSIAELKKEGTISTRNGHEIGSKNYGIGPIPFIRTSEIGNWEIVEDPTHCTSIEQYNHYGELQNIEPQDILVVKDGTYLMGRSAMITEADTKIIFQSHFKRIKVLKKDKLSPYLLLALLNLEIVQKQFEAKSFRQGTISTIGNRMPEIRLPIPIAQDIKDDIISTVKEIMDQKEKAKLKAQEFSLEGKSESLMGIKNKAQLSNL